MRHGRLECLAGGIVGAWASLILGSIVLTVAGCNAVVTRDSETYVPMAEETALAKISAARTDACSYWFWGGSQRGACRLEGVADHGTRLGVPRNEKCLDFRLSTTQRFEQGRMVVSEEHMYCFFEDINQVSLDGADGAEGCVFVSEHVGGETKQWRICCPDASAAREFASAVVTLSPNLGAVGMFHDNTRAR